MIIFGICVAFVLTSFMSESYKTTIIERRAKKLGLSLSSESKPSTLDSVRLFLAKTITRPIYMMFTEPIVMSFDIYNAFNFGLLNAFFSAYAWVYVTSLNPFFDLVAY